MVFVAFLSYSKEYSTSIDYIFLSCPTHKFMFLMFSFLSAISVCLPLKYIKLEKKTKKFTTKQRLKRVQQDY